MALFGAQLVITMVMASFLSKLSIYYSFGRWLLSDKLARFMPPSDDEMRKLAHVSQKNKGRNKGENSRRGPEEDFNVPRNADIQLECSPVKPLDLLVLHFYQEYQWLMDFTVCGVIVYAATEVYYGLVDPRTEMNLSMLWCILIALFAVKILYSLTAIYFRTEEGGERILCIVFGFFFLVVAMGVLIVDEEILELDLYQAYQNFSSEAQTFLKQQGLESSGPSSLVTLRISLAVVAAIIGAFLTFPGLRLAKMYLDSLKYLTGNPLKQLFLHINVLLPLFVSLLWIRPLFRELLVERKYRNNAPVLTAESFEMLRICIMFVFCLFRFSLLWIHLQSHLNLAVDRVGLLKRETGYIKATDLKKLVVRIYYYLCVVALQYLAPIVLLLFCVLMLKTLGDFSLRSVFGLPMNSTKTSTATSAASSSGYPSTLLGSALDQETVASVLSTASEFTVAFSQMKHIFTPIFFRGLFSFLCWWICTAWFVTNAFGIVYYTYFIA